MGHYIWTDGTPILCYYVKDIIIVLVHPAYEYEKSNNYYCFLYHYYR